MKETSNSVFQTEKIVIEVEKIEKHFKDRLEEQKLVKKLDKKIETEKEEIVVIKIQEDFIFDLEAKQKPIIN